MIESTILTSTNTRGTLTLDDLGQPAQLAIARVSIHKNENRALAREENQKKASSKLMKSACKRGLPPATEYHNREALSVAGSGPPWAERSQVGRRKQTPTTSTAPPACNAFAQAGSSPRKHISTASPIGIRTLLGTTQKKERNKLGNCISHIANANAMTTSFQLSFYKQTKGNQVGRNNCKQVLSETLRFTIALLS